MRARPLTSGLLGVLFAFAIQATAAGWRQCPHHDQVAPEHAAAAHHDGHAPDAPAHEDGPCSCLSGAQCGVPLALHTTPAAHLVAAGTVTFEATTPLVHQAPARIPSLYLPEATAPPAVL